MVWAMLAAFLTRKPPIVQAVVLGLCTGLFVSALATANQRDPRISAVAVLVLVAGAITGRQFRAGLAYQRQHGWTPENPAPGWLYAVYAAVWPVGLVAAVLALFGDGGFTVAVLAIVPLVLIAPTALHGMGQMLHRRRAPAWPAGPWWSPEKRSS